MVNREYLTPNQAEPDDDFGCPIDPALRGLRYPIRGMHLRPIAERLEFEQEMRDWIALGEGYGLSPAASMMFSLYL